MARIGKIARLPRVVREELNQRLADGGTGKKLVAWLNELPEVCSVIAGEFGGEPISERNLSRWKQGGFQDWLRDGEAREWVGGLFEEYDDLEGASGDRRMTDRLTTPLLFELHKLLCKGGASENLAEQRKAVLGVAGRLAQLRRADHEAERARLKAERLKMAGTEPMPLNPA